MSEQSSSPQDTGHSDSKGLMRFDAAKKSLLVAYLLWFFLGIMAAHRFYLGEMKTGGILVSLWALGLIITLLGAGAGLFFIVIASFWAFIDLFLIPGMTRRRNDELYAQLQKTTRTQ
ncbi:MAG: TM2 domain-containing protein [Alphaproteobacteria bacterium]|nr:TM2 domain-containing protein [Alphaproteobacteria bacterium]